MTTKEFNHRYQSIEELLFGFAMSLTKNRESAKDLMQETLLRAFKSKNAYRLNTNFKAWMTTIMRNNFINSYRKQKTRSRVVLPIKDFLLATQNKTAANDSSASIFMQELQQFIYDLPDSQRIPFEMHYQGYQYDEIAAETEVAIGTVKSRIFFARKKLKQTLQTYYGDTLQRA